jgi:hypothetical protein
MIRIKFTCEDGSGQELHLKRRVIHIEMEDEKSVITIQQIGEHGWFVDDEPKEPV